MSVNVELKKLHPEAVVPTYGTERSSGADLYALEDVVVRPGETVVVRTGIAIAIKGIAWLADVQIRPRSGLTSKTKLRVANAPGTIDEDYRGELKVLIDNIAQIEPMLIKDPRGNPLLVPLTSSNVRLVSGGHVVHADERGMDFPEGTYLILKGDRIAQAVLTDAYQMAFTEVDELPDTKRGSGGFGHTGS